jgi:hypothetical protein
MFWREFLRTGLSTLLSAKSSQGDRVQVLAFVWIL